MRWFFESFAVAFGMYSRLPVPRADWNEKNMKYCICFFPLIGAVIGLAVNLVYLLCAQLGTGPLLRTSLLVLVPAGITGGIHLDGLLDTADALASWKSREEKLEILKDSHAGAFAVIAGICYFVLLYGAMSEADAADLRVIGLGYCLSRAWSGLGVVTLRKAKNTGLLYAFADGAQCRRVALVMGCYIALLTAGMLWADPVRGAAASLLAVLVYVWYRYISYHKFGGITGDLAGFFLQLCELVTALGVVLI